MVQDFRQVQVKKKKKSVNVPSISLARSSLDAARSFRFCGYVIELAEDKDKELRRVRGPSGGGLRAVGERSSATPPKAALADSMQEELLSPAASFTDGTSSLLPTAAEQDKALEPQAQRFCTNTSTKRR
jgi:hypothetical protein